MPKVLLVSQGAAFMVSSLESNLSKSGIEVGQSTLEDAAYGGIIWEYDIVLLFAGDFIDQESGLLQEIASQCEENFIHFCAVGYPNELTKLEKSVNVAQISAEFERPFEMRAFIDWIKKLAFGESAASSEPSARPVKKKHILVCNDDSDYLKRVSDGLSPMYKITAAKSGMTAISYAHANRPDIILLDIDMPMTLESFRADRKLADIPVIFVSERSDKDALINVMRMKPQGFVLSSLRSDELAATLDNFFSTGQWRVIQI